MTEEVKYSTYTKGGRVPCTEYSIFSKDIRTIIGSTEITSDIEFDIVVKFLVIGDDVDGVKDLVFVNGNGTTEAFYNIRKGAIIPGPIKKILYQGTVLGELVTTTVTKVTAYMGVE